MSENLQDLQNFIEEWQDVPEGNREAFIHLKNLLEGLDNVRLDFKAREGLTYSLRGSHICQKSRPLFIMIDVIEGEPRWLSVCFYATMITDPEEKGDFVPEGLLGEDAVCFDLEQNSAAELHYLEQRLAEAYASAVTN
jgi:hypothetical protein